MALLTAVHIINISPNKPLGLRIPQELLGNVFSLVMDQKAKWDIDFGTPNTDKSFEVRT